MMFPQVTFSGVGTTLTDGFHREYSLDVDDGWIAPDTTRIWRIIGDSGSGKTTLLRLLGLIDQAHRGTLTWRLPGEEAVELMAGKSAAALRRHRLGLYRRHFGFAFQHAPLQPQLTVMDNLRLWRQISARPPLGEQQIIDLARPLFSSEKRVRELLCCYPFEALSMGEKQRFVLLQAIAHDPSVLFVDEPTANLDGDSGARVSEFIDDWVWAKQSERLVLWVTHDRQGDSIPVPHIRVKDGRAQIITDFGGGGAAVPMNPVQDRLAEVLK